jgi:hypothetical protein
MGSEKITALPATPRLVARIRHSSAVSMDGTMSREASRLKGVLFLRV